MNLSNCHHIYQTFFPNSFCGSHAINSLISMSNCRIIVTRTYMCCARTAQILREMHMRTRMGKDTLFLFYKNIVFPAQAEYPYFSADFRLKIFLWYSLNYSIWHFRLRMSRGINYKCLVFSSCLLHCTYFVLHKYIKCTAYHWTFGYR